MSTTTFISPAMRSAVGQECLHRTSYPIAASDIRRWAIAVYHPAPAPPIFWDDKLAGAARHVGIVAPEEFNPFAWAVDPYRSTTDQIEANDPDRIEQLLGISGPRLEHQVHGGIEVTYHSRMHVGAVIVSSNRLLGYTERDGRLGPMLFTITEDTWTNDAGDLVKTSRATSIRY